MKKKTKEKIVYLSNGVLTTIVNYSVFMLLSMVEVQYIVSNSLAWVIAVLFAYGTNRKYVFDSQENIKKEFVSFTSLRLISLIIENLSLSFCIHFVGIPIILSKLIVSFSTILINYFICKYLIFNKGGPIHG